MLTKTSLWELVTYNPSPTNMTAEAIDISVDNIYIYKDYTSYMTSVSFI